MTTTAVELRSSNGHVEREWIEVMAPALELAKHVVDTEFVPRGLRGNAAGIVAAIMYGDELGLGPMQALAKIAVIDGKPTLSAEAQRALILAAGHEIWLEEATTTKVTVAGRRSGSERTSSVTWTLDDAKRAGIAGKTNWRSYPRQMLQARATAELARLIFADVIGGLAATEELEDVDVFDSSPLPAATESGSTTKRRRASRKRKPPALDADDVGTRTSEVNPPAPALPPLPDEPADTLVDPDKPPAESPENDSLDIGEPTVADNDAGEVSPADETTAASETGSSSPVASPASNDDDVLTGALDAITEAQKKALNSLVGQLREAEVELEDGTKSKVLSTEQLWAATARRRNVDVDVMIELLGGRDEAGVLHWSPLRESLTKPEASDLISSLEDRMTRYGVGK